MHHHHAPQTTSTVTRTTTRLRHATRRWLRIFGFAIFGAIEFHVILPLAWHWVRPINLPYTPFFIKTATLLGTFLLIYLLLEPIRIRRGQWSTYAWYPPLWFSLVLACALAAGMDCLPVDIRPSTERLHWHQIDVILPIVAVFLAAMLLRQVPRPSPLPSSARSHRNTNETTSVARSPGTWCWGRIRDWISAGEHPITDDRHDLFARAPVADRIARSLQEGRSVALLGAYGTGKSSILNLVRAKLAQGSNTTIVANLDVWAVPRPEDVPRLALEQVVDALDHHVDTLGLRNIPVTYQRLVAALPMRNVSMILRLQAEGDSLAELQRLVPTLEVLNARLVLFIEDVDRLTRRFDTRHLQRLLWGLRAVPRVSFALAFDPGKGPNIDFSKLCDTMELLRPMEYEHVGAILVNAVNHWRRAYPDMDARLDSRGSILRLEYHQAGGIYEYLRRVVPASPLHHLVALLQTPRRLRQVLRRVDLIWQQLHGEADLEEIIILTAIREAATPVYEFLFTHIDAARHPPGRVMAPVTDLREEWNCLTTSLPNGPAARQLVGLLGIQQLSEGPRRLSPQGVHLSHPVDYFRRIAAEQLDLEELRDQTVLEDIDSWRRARAESLVDRLVAGSDDGNRYADVWLHFSERHATNELTELTSRVVERVLAREGSEADGRSSCTGCAVPHVQPAATTGPRGRVASGADPGSRARKSRVRDGILQQLDR